ncbi:MAG: GNAT family N-acetyltransferase [Candidatus Jettenia sp.]|nr:MAG: GNAT family N-acetyltransferase [Candidatus Jettenia sp.]
MVSVFNNPVKWDEAVESSYYPYISYKYGWLESIGSCFLHMEPLPLAKVTEDGGIEYVCPCFIDRDKKEITSSAFLAPGFINKNADPVEMIEALISYAKKENYKKISLQIPPGFMYSNILLNGRFKLIRKICFFAVEICAMSSFDYYLNKCVSSGRKSDMKAAWRKGVTVETLYPSREALERFYPFYQEMVQRNNAQMLEKTFMLKLSQSLNQNTRYWIAMVHGKDIGSALTYEFMGRLWVWLLQGGGDFRDYKTDAFLYAEIIRYGFEKHFRVIDLGTSPLDNSQGDFKKRLGANPVFHELYELDLSYFGNLRSTCIEMKKVIKRRWAN